MHEIHSAVSILVLVFYALCAAGASISRPKSVPDDEVFSKLDGDGLETTSTSVTTSLIRRSTLDEGYVRRREIDAVINTLTNHTILQLPNQNSFKPPPTFNTTSFLWPIPDTDSGLALKFYIAGIPIPEQKVRKTLEGALNQVVSKALGNDDKEEPIDNDAFERTLPSNGDGTETGVTILSYPVGPSKLTWEQLYISLNGLYQYATGVNGDKKQHFNVLGFKIVKETKITSMEIAVGTLWYYPRRWAAADNGATSANQKTSLLTNSTSPSEDGLTVDESTLWPIRNTDIVLDFVFRGQDIPAIQLTWTLDKAQNAITDIVHERPNDPNDSFNYQPEGSDVYINIIATGGQQITWLELSQILSGVREFCDSINHKVLVFDIEIRGVRVGFGTLLYLDPNVEGRHSVPFNGTLAMPNLVNGSISISYNIPNTQYHLDFTRLGNAVPGPKIIGTLSEVLKSIADNVQKNPDRPIYLNRFVIDDPSGVSLAILSSTSIQMTYKQLDEILTGLTCFVVGANPRRGGGDLGTHFQTLKFNIILQGQGYVGTGLLGYTPRPGVAVEKRDALGPESVDSTSLSEAPPTLSEQPNINETTNPSNLTLPYLPALLGNPIPYPVPSTPMTLTLNLNGRRVPQIYLTAFLTTALRRLRHNVTTIPNERIPWNIYNYGDGTSGLTFNYLGYDTATWLTWRQLSWVLRGILGFVSAGEQNCRGMVAEVDVRVGRAVEGTRFGAAILWYGGDEAAEE